MMAMQAEKNRKDRGLKYSDMNEPEMPSEFRSDEATGLAGQTCHDCGGLLLCICLCGSSLRAASPTAHHECSSRKQKPASERCAPKRTWQTLDPRTARAGRGEDHENGAAAQRVAGSPAGGEVGRPRGRERVEAKRDTI